VSILERAVFNTKEKKYFSTELYFEFCGASQTLPLHAAGPSRRDNYLIHFVLDGEGIYSIKDNRYKLKKGDIFIIRPDEMYFYQADAVNPWTYAWISIGGKAFSEIIERSKFRDNVYSFSTDNIDAYAEIILACLKLHHETFEEELLLNEETYKLINLLMSDTGGAIGKNDRALSELTMQAMNYIEGNYQNQLSVQEIAEFLSVDRSYLSRVFKKDLGTPIKKWLTGVRINEAAYLLAKTPETVEEIAYQVGFTSVVIFSRTFHQIIQETPTQYRKRMKQTNIEGESFSELFDLLAQQTITNIAT
jgi:AraC-like DNA-binding protein